MPDPTSPVSTITNAAATTVNTLSVILDRFEKWKNLKSETNSLVRLFYLEINKNMELLELVDFKSKKKIEYTDSGFQFLVQNFETGVMEMIFIGDSQDNLYKFLQTNGRIPDNLNKDRKFRYENILQAVCFVYVKMDILKKLSCSECPNELLKGIKIRERLLHVRQRLIMIKEKLEELDDIKSLARQIVKNC